MQLSLYMMVLSAIIVPACTKSQFSSSAAAPVSVTISEDATATGSNGTAEANSDATPIANDITEDGGSAAKPDTILETASNSTNSGESGTRSLDKSDDLDVEDSITGSHPKNGTGKAKKGGNSSKSAADFCAKNLGIPVNQVKIAGQHKNIELTSSDVVAVKLTGNQNAFTLKLTSPGKGAKIAGVCIFIAGHRGQINVESEASIGQIYVKERGDHPRVSFVMGEGLTVDGMKANLNGNQPSLTIEGAGDFDCTKISGAGFTCKP